MLFFVLYKGVSGMIIIIWFIAGISALLLARGVISVRMQLRASRDRLIAAHMDDILRAILEEGQVIRLGPFPTKLSRYLGDMYVVGLENEWGTVIVHAPETGWWWVKYSGRMNPEPCSFVRDYKREHEMAGKLAVFVKTVFPHQEEDAA